MSESGVPQAAALARDETKNEEAIAAFLAIVDDESQEVRARESAVYRIVQIVVLRERDMARVCALMERLERFLAGIAKARTAKIVRKTLDAARELCLTAADNTVVSEGGEAALAQLRGLVEHWLAWAKRQERRFLQRFLEARLAQLQLAQGQFRPCLRLSQRLAREVKKMDDKLLLVEVLLTESRAHQRLLNLPVAKATLTAARATSHSVHCPPELQCQIDLHAGILCAEQRDYKTAFSYFFEAFEVLDNEGRKADALLALKYMLLTKMLAADKALDEVDALLGGKHALHYRGPDLEAMRAIAEAYKQRNLRLFKEALTQHGEYLHGVAVLDRHLGRLHDTLLEQNLQRVLLPYKRVQIAHVADVLLDGIMPRERVEAKLREMILDDKLSGILDQGAGDLLLFDEHDKDALYENSITAVDNLGKVVEKLYEKAKLITT
ncbi:MAG: hypothetical protein MHM6MM_004019 [Cercozoa sp. M6MM]